jgi:hypothetical protein
MTNIPRLTRNIHQVEEQKKKEKVQPAGNSSHSVSLQLNLPPSPIA